MGRDENLDDLEMIRRLLTASRESESFGQRVRRRRKEKRLTLDEMAERTGMAKSYLSQIETGYAPPPRDEKIRRIADALDLAPERLLSTARLSELPEPVKAHLLRLVEEADRAIRRLPPRDETPAAETDTPGPAAGAQADTGAGQEDRAAGALDLDALHRSGLLHHLARADDREQEAVALRAVPIINKVAAGYPREFTDLGYPVGIADDYVSVPAEMADPNAFAVRVVGDSMEPRYREGDVVIFSPAAPVHSGDDCFVRFAPGSGPAEDESTFKRVFFDGPDAVRLQPLNERYAPTTVSPAAIGRIFRAAARYEQL
jgi:phage repressor protein C with HTH and peptisase S24 domain/DNA-binding Xre family transcriptional regulator